VPPPTPTVTTGSDSDADHKGSLLDIDLLLDDPNSVSFQTPGKVTETAEISALSDVNDFSSSCNKKPPTSIRGTTRKPARPSVPAVILSPSTTDIGAQEAGHQASGTVVAHLNVSSINSWYDYINSYMKTATQTGAAINTRAFKNAAASRISSAIWKRSSLGMLA
jgi:hypothetical protein